MTRKTTTLLFALYYIFLQGIQGKDSIAQVAWFVQVSDIHLSKWGMDPVDPRERDLQALFENVIPNIDPATVLITGDLTDSKTKGGKGKQNFIEWEAYSRVINMMKNSTGLSSILDVRGNHDMFDAGYKGGQDDHYPSLGARKEIFQGREDRVLMIDEVYGQIGKNFQGCPAVVMIGLDLTQNPGFRGPTNFAAMISDKTMEELDQEIHAKLRNYQSCEIHPTILAYSHYPLCVTAYTDIPLWKQAFKIQTVEFKLQNLFQKYNVSAYFNGHLHNAFGEQLHRLIPAKNKQYIAELQTADWKYSRRFRIVAVDEGQLAFSDHQFRRSDSNQEFGISSIEDNFKLVDNFLVVITSPVDGRYSPLIGSSNGGNKQSNLRIRALVFQVGEINQQEFSVEGQFICSGENRKQFVQMQKINSYNEKNNFLYEGKLPSELDCNSDGNITVAVLFKNKQIDSYSSIPISLNQFKLQQNENQSVKLKPLPLNQQFLENIALKYSWPIVGFWMFYGSWFFIIFFLLVFPFLISNFTQFLTQFEEAQNRRDLWTFFMAPIYFLCKFSFQGFSLWIFYFIYVIYLGFFPWLLIKLVGKFPYAFALPFGVIIPFENQPVQYFPTPELLVVFSSHLILVMIPTTFFVSWIFSRCSQMECEQKNKKCVVNIWQIVLFLMILYFHVKIMSQMVKWYDALSIIVSPGMGWLLPLLLLFMYIVQKQYIGGGYCKCE